MVARKYGVDAAAMTARLQQTADRFNLPMGNFERIYNSRKAQELGLWAQSKGRGPQFHRAAFQAYFADDRNIARVPVLLDVAACAGLSRREAKSVIETGAFAAAVDADWALSRERGIRVVPTFVMGDARLVGAKPYAVMQQFVENSGTGSKEP